MTKPKRQKRGVERTKLLMCEGITDKRFADCLKRLLTTRKSGFSVRLDDAGGGGPKSAIMAAINHAGGFDKRVSRFLRQECQHRRRVLFHLI